ncbi:chromate transporter [Amylibacter ulvae]|uniref:Chromate transporter n=1 Tax=Paramylibacter ulvae TaxID=1651968 RepID=A0ABQ3CZQ7_9RHOB|nr:chromate efflux transporter [Amylibacter ulvae]GHA50963.1 chromate transporter [Amylibacter ulvae]
MSSTPTLRTASRVWTKIGLLSFGGPAAQIALMHREIVEQNQWLTERQFLNALNFSMLLPGPEAMQLATYAGWRLHGTIGGLIAGLMFVLPGAFVIAILATIYAYFGSVPLVSDLFLGVKATVVIIVIEALLRVAKKALHQPLHWAIALAAFIGIFFLQIPYPLIVLLAALTGWAFLKNSDISEPVQPRQPLSKMLRTVVIWLAIWWLPVLALELVTEQSILTEIAYFFSKLAVVTFGGAYAVLAYMAQDVVAIKGWLQTGEMMDGLGLAETTPGPLILVTEFVGFIAGFRDGGIGMAIMAAIVTLWVTFAPCFLWIFAVAPYIDWIGAQPRLHGALSAITAAVVGVILNLSIWFALHVFFDVVNTNTLGPITLLIPSIASINWLVVSLAILCGVLLLKRHWNVVTVLGLSGALAAIASAVGLG